MDIINIREEWIEKSRNDFLEIAKRYQKAIIKTLRDKYLPYLTQNDGAIVFSPKNMATIAELDKLLTSVSNLEGDKLIGWFKDQIEKSANINSKYYNEIINGKIDTESAIKSISISLGLNDKNGILFELSRIKDPIRKIKVQAIKAISSGVSWSEFSKDITNFVGKGLIEGHMRTNAYDTFQQIDRKINVDLGINLGLRYYLFSSGLMKTSRQFCKDRVGKIFTHDEIMAWKKIDWDGKNENYNPLIDVGGYNCTHTLSMVTDKFAFERRPELKKGQH